MPLFTGTARTVLFVHIPKTGGSSIETWLSRHARMSFFASAPPNGLKVCPQHLQYNDLVVLLGRESWDYAFTIVRNPYDRLLSDYFHFVPYQEGQRMAERPDFSNWIVNNIRYFNQNPFHLDNHMRPQVHFLGEGVEIFRYEDGLDAAAGAIAQAAGVPLDGPLPMLRQTNKHEVTWSTEALSVVNEFFRDDFRELGYPLRALMSK